MGPREEADEKVSGLRRRAAVEGHQGGRAASQCYEVRPPAVGPYGRHLNLVDTTVDGLFETV